MRSSVGVDLVSGRGSGASARGRTREPDRLFGGEGRTRSLSGKHAMRRLCGIIQTKTYDASKKEGLALQHTRTLTHT
eukprot:scaffold2465_cov74-Phaeocystis_antarctica.AAC.4